MKKLFKKSLAVILTALLLISTVPITVSAAETTVGSVGPRSGYTGDCTWILDDEGTLTISGNGEMRDYESDGSYYSYAPWSYTELHCSKVIIITLNIRIVFGENTALDDGLCFLIPFTDLRCNL